MPKKPRSRAMEESIHSLIHYYLGDDVDIPRPTDTDKFVELVTQLGDVINRMDQIVHDVTVNRKAGDECCKENKRALNVALLGRLV